MCVCVGVGCRVTVMQITEQPRDRSALGSRGGLIHLCGGKVVGEPACGGSKWKLGRASCVEPAWQQCDSLGSAQGQGGIGEVPGSSEAGHGLAGTPRKSPLWRPRTPSLHHQQAEVSPSQDGITKYGCCLLFISEVLTGCANIFQKDAPSTRRVGGQVDFCSSPQRL